MTTRLGENAGACGCVDMLSPFQPEFKMDMNYKLINIKQTNPFKTASLVITEPELPTNWQRSACQRLAILPLRTLLCLCYRSKCFHSHRPLLGMEVRKVSEARLKHRHLCLLCLATRKQRNAGRLLHLSYTWAMPHCSAMDSISENIAEGRQDAQTLDGNEKNGRARQRNHERTKEEHQEGSLVILNFTSIILISSRFASHTWFWLHPLLWCHWGLRPRLLGLWTRNELHI